MGACCELPSSNPLDGKPLFSNRIRFFDSQGNFTKELSLREKLF